MNWIKKLFRKKRGTSVRSGTYCRCDVCGYEGYAYGVPTAEGGTNGFCQRCGISNRLIPIQPEVF